jgi:hypothetical protein
MPHLQTGARKFIFKVRKSVLGFCTTNDMRAIADMFANLNSSLPLIADENIGDMANKAW